MNIINPSIIILLLTAITVHSESCSDYLTCDKCLSATVMTCVWCNNREFVKEFYYPCGIYQNIIATGCPILDIITVVPNVKLTGNSTLISPVNVSAYVKMYGFSIGSVTLGNL